MSGLVVVHCSDLCPQLLHLKHLTHLPLCSPLHLLHFPLGSLNAFVYLAFSFKSRSTFLALHTASCNEEYVIALILSRIPNFKDTRNWRITVFSSIRRSSDIRFKRSANSSTLSSLSIFKSQKSSKLTSSKHFSRRTSFIFS
eukprot:NODE_119_length_18186_cov_1.929397.p13 type:complete len:142 gc:universal NODE_119_length_18186_cov_1.929397:712-287(-)